MNDNDDDLFLSLLQDLNGVEPMAQPDFSPLSPSQFNPSPTTTTSPTTITSTNTTTTTTSTTSTSTSTTPNEFNDDTLQEVLEELEEAEYYIKKMSGFVMDRNKTLQLLDNAIDLIGEFITVSNSKMITLESLRNLNLVSPLIDKIWSNSNNKMNKNSPIVDEFRTYITRDIKSNINKLKYRLTDDNLNMQLYIFIYKHLSPGEQILNARLVNRRPYQALQTQLKMKNDIHFIFKMKKSINYDIDDLDIIPLFTTMMCWEGVILNHASQMAQIFGLAEDKLAVLRNGGFTLKNMLDMLSLVITNCTDNMNDMRITTHIVKGDREPKKRKLDVKAVIQDDKKRKVDAKSVTQDNVFLKHIRTLTREITESVKSDTYVNEFIDRITKQSHNIKTNNFIDLQKYFKVGNTTSRKLFSCIDLLMRINNDNDNSQYSDHTSCIESMVDFTAKSSDIIPLYTIIVSWDQVTRKYASILIKTLFKDNFTSDIVNKVGLTVEDILYMFTYIVEITGENFAGQLNN